MIGTVEQKKTNLSLKFQVADVRKPLIAVDSICKMGNQVSFMPHPTDNFIQNKDTGDKIMLRKVEGRGSYLMDVKFQNGKSTVITVDSGAEVSVCPYGWGQEFGLQEPEKRCNMIGANGTPIAHYGQRKVLVESLSF